MNRVGLLFFPFLQSRPRCIFSLPLDKPPGPCARARPFPPRFSSRVIFQQTKPTLLVLTERLGFTLLTIFRGRSVSSKKIECLFRVLGPIFLARLPCFFRISFLSRRVGKSGQSPSPYRESGVRRKKRLFSPAASLFPSKDGSRPSAASVPHPSAMVE